MATLGRYTLIRRVGVGGMGEVWKAKVRGPAGFEKNVAIKKILPAKMADPGFIQMFVNEAKLLARLVHPNIVQVFDFGMDEEDEHYYLVLEYVGGQNLARIRYRLAKRGTKLPVEVAMYIGAEAAKSLAFAHSLTDSNRKPLGLVHRDVSAQNVLVSYSGEVKVTDFGIARVASALPITRVGQLKGKSSYLSPEQARAEPLDGRSDIFSLGIVIWEMLAGRKLFTGENRGDFVDKISNFPGVGPELLKGMPDIVHDILRSALEPDRDKRYSSATELEADLIRAVGIDTIIQARQALGSILQVVFRAEVDTETKEEAGEVAEVSIKSKTFIGKNPLEQLIEKSIQDDPPAVVPGHPPGSADSFTPLGDSGEIPQELAVGGTQPGPRPQPPPQPPSPVVRSGDTVVSARPELQAAPQMPFSLPEPEEFEMPGPDPIGPRRKTVPARPVPLEDAGGDAPPWEEMSSGTEPFPERRPHRVRTILGYVLMLVLGLVAGRFLFAPATARWLASMRSTPEPAPVDTPDIIISAETPIYIDTGATPTATPKRSPRRTRAPVAATPSAVPTSTGVARLTPTLRPTQTAKPTATAVADGSPVPSATLPVPIGPAGYLAIDSRPWAEVWIDGIRVGNTPLAKVELPVGRHDVELINPVQDLRRRRTVNVKEGQTLQLRVNLESP